MKKAILLVIGIVIAALALVTPLQDQVRWIVNHGSHQRISVEIVNGEPMRCQVIQLDSTTQVTTLIIG